MLPLAQQPARPAALAPLNLPQTCPPVWLVLPPWQVLVEAPQQLDLEGLRSPGGPQVGGSAGQGRRSPTVDMARCPPLLRTDQDPNNNQDNTV